LHAHASADELNLNVRAEDDGQAQLKAHAALAQANDDQTTLQLTLYGNTILMAGINVTVAGFGQLNGKYTVTSSTHRLSRQSGYVSMLALKRVRNTA
jgi:phage protein D